MAEKERGDYALTEEFDWVELENGDLLVVLRAGATSTAEEICARPKSRFVAEFMGEVNFFDLVNGTASDVTMSDGARASLFPLSRA